MRTLMSDHVQPSFASTDKTMGCSMIPSCLNQIASTRNRFMELFRVGVDGDFDGHRVSGLAEVWGSITSFHRRSQLIPWLLQTARSVLTSSVLFHLRSEHGALMP